MLANRSKSAYAEDNSSVFASDKEDAGNASPFRPGQHFNKTQHRSNSIVTPMKMEDGQKVTQITHKKFEIPFLANFA